MHGNLIVGELGSVGGLGNEGLPGEELEGREGEGVEPLGLPDVPHARQPDEPRHLGRPLRQHLVIPPRANTCMDHQWKWKERGEGPVGRALVVDVREPCEVVAGLEDGGDLGDAGGAGWGPAPVLHNPAPLGHALGPLGGEEDVDALVVQVGRRRDQQLLGLLLPQSQCQGGSGRDLDGLLVEGGGVPGGGLPAAEVGHAQAPRRAQDALGAWQQVSYSISVEATVESGRLTEVGEIGSQLGALPGLLKPGGVLGPVGAQDVGGDGRDLQSPQQSPQCR